MDADRRQRLQAEWCAAEERLYPLAMVDPDGYRRALGMVGVLLGWLRAQDGGTEWLEEVSARPAELLDMLPDTRPPAIADATLLGAALAIRARELAAAEAESRRAELIEAARAEGRDWVHLGGPADLEATPGGNRFELHLPSGVGLITGVDPWSGEDPFLLRALPGDAGGRERVERFADQDAWRTEYQRWRHGVTTLTTGEHSVSDSG